MTVLLLAAQLFSWFATTKIGRIVGLVALVIGILFIAYLKVKAMGRAEERRKTEEEIAKHVETKNEVDSRIGSLSDSAVDAELRKWTKD